MNWKRGNNRLIFILSIIGACLGFYAVREYCLYSWGTMGYTSQVALRAFVIGVVLGCCSVWLAYYLVKWIINGYRGDQPKDEQRQ